MPHFNELKVIFGGDGQLFAPLFQRPYVWDEKNQWEPLWNDIRRIAEKQLHITPTTEEITRSIFTGPRTTESFS